MIATISSEVATGRSMKIRDGFMSRVGLLVGLRGPVGAGGGRATVAAIGLASPLLLLGASLLSIRRRSGNRRVRRGARRGARPADLGAVAQAVGTVDHHLVADLQAAHDLHLLAIGHAQ